MKRGSWQSGKNQRKVDNIWGICKETKMYKLKLH